MDLETIRRQAYALAELENTVHLFCTALVYLGTEYAHDRRRGWGALVMLAEVLDWSDELALPVKRPKEAA